MADGQYNNHCAPQESAIKHSITYGYLAKALSACTSHPITQTTRNAMQMQQHPYRRSSQYGTSLAVTQPIEPPSPSSSSFSSNRDHDEDDLDRQLMDDRPFAIGDYGCSQGKNSILLVNAILKQLRYDQKSPAINNANNHKLSLSSTFSSTITQAPADESTDIICYHTDLPTNDFSSLYSLFTQEVNGTTNEERYEQQQQQQRSLLRENSANVFNVTVGRSFFQRNLPTNHVDFAVASSAFQWLSAVPSPLNGSTWIHSNRLNGDIQTRTLWEDAAANDWKTILQHRAMELRTGGVLLLHNPARVEVPTTTNDIPLHIGDLMRDLVSEVFPLIGTGLTEFTLPLYRRTYAEHTDPTIMRECGLTILFAEIVQVHNPINAEYKYNKNIHAFAREYTHHVRAINQPALEYALKKYTMLDNVDEMISIYFEALEKKIIKMVETDGDNMVDKLAKRQYTMYMAMKKL